jgi:hypothetical protein
MIDVEAQFSPDATLPEPVVAWITIIVRPTSAEKEATTTKLGITAQTTSCCGSSPSTPGCRSGMRRTSRVVVSSIVLP